MHTDFGIPCLFHELTSLRCPGCGITRMVIAIVRLDFKTAFSCNPFVFITGPFIIAYIAFYEIKYVISGSRPAKKWDIFIWIIFISSLIYGVLRNIFPI